MICQNTGSSHVNTPIFSFQSTQRPRRIFLPSFNPFYRPPHRACSFTRKSALPDPDGFRVLHAKPPVSVTLNRCKEFNPADTGEPVGGGRAAFRPGEKSLAGKGFGLPVRRRFRLPPPSVG